MNTKFKRVVTALAAGLIAIGTVGALSACGGHQHAYVQHDARSATCETAGHDAYYSCLGCQKYFDLDKNEIKSVTTTPALGHQFKNVETVPATMTQDGCGAHSICERDGCDKWFDYYYSYGSQKPEVTYPAWLKIRAGLPGSWMVYEATKVIEKGPNPAETYTMTYAEYFAADDDDELRQLFVDVLGGEAGFGLLEDGRMLQTGTLGTWTQEDDSTIKTDITRVNYGHEERTYTVLEDGRLQCTWTHLSTTTTIVLAKVSNVENIVL